MQAERIQVLVQQAAAGNVDAFVVLVQEFAPALRVALGAHLDQPAALVPVEAAVWSSVRSRLGEWLPETPFGEWLLQVAIDPVAAHLAQADRRAIDIQDALSHQIIQQCRAALADGSELQVLGLSTSLSALPEVPRTLLMRRYRERRLPAALAASLMISEAELATSLAAARAACDWRGLAKPPGPGDRLLPPLIEDWLNGTIDVDSRALLATNLGRDLERAQQFARQVRVHLVLGAALAPFTREDAVAITRQAGVGAGDSGRVMMGESVRPSAPARPAGSDARRPSRMGTSNRQMVPLTDDEQRPSPMPWIIGGGMVLVGVVALVLFSLGDRPARSSPPTAAQPPSEPTVPSTGTTPEQTTANRPAGGGVLRPQPIAPGDQKVMLVGVTAGAQVYTGVPFELRALVSGLPDVSAVEYWAGNQRLGSAREIPFSMKWTPSQPGAITVQARAMVGAVTKVSSEALPLTVMKAYGSRQITREWWSGLPGDEVALALGRLTSTTPPTGRSIESQFSAPRSWEDAFLQRLSGYLIPPLDGEYVFWICADNEAELWLSTDDSYTNRTRIAVAPYIRGGAIPYQAWDHDTRQRSAPIRLRAGQRYYCEALHKEGGGDDHLDVGWKLPDGTLQRPIPGIHLTPAPAAPTPTGPAVAPTPPPVVNTPAAPSMLVLWNGDNVAGGSGYASTGIAKVAGSGRDGSMGLQATMAQGFANLGWNWFSWAPDDAGSDLRTHKAIVFWMRIDGANRPTSASLQFLSSPKSVQARSASIDVAALVPQFADGQWHEVVIPLERLTAPGFDLAKVWEFNLKLQGKGTLASTVSFDDITALAQLPGAAATTAPVLPVSPDPSSEARRPDLMIWDGEGTSGGAGYKGFGGGGQSPLDHTPGHGRSGAALRARLGGGDAANVGWNWHAWSFDGAGTDLSGFAALTMWVRFTGPAAPQQVVMRLACSPREPVRRTVDVNLSERQPGLMDGAWHQVIVPFSDLVPTGHDFDRAKVWEIAFDLSSTATMDGTFDVDEIGALRSLTPPSPAAALVWKPVRAINLGGETTDVDGVRMFGHRQAEADGASPATSHQPGPWLSDLNWVRGTTGVGEIRRDRSMEDRPLTIDGKVYAKGLGVHGNSELVFALDGRQSGFTAVVGVDDEVQPVAELIFQVWLDSQKVWDSGVMRKGMAKPVAIPLVGRKELRLVVDSNGPGDWDHADWANAQFLVPGGDDGALQVQVGRRATATFTPKPPVDVKTRALLSTALVGTKEGLAFRVKAPNGPSRVWVWLAENGAANSRQFDLTVEGVTLAGVGMLPAGGWEKLGPIDLNLADGYIDVAATVLKGIPQVMGIVVEQQAAEPLKPAP